MNPACPDCGRASVPLRRNGRVDRHRTITGWTADGEPVFGDNCTARGVKPEYPATPRNTR